MTMERRRRTRRKTERYAAADKKNLGGGEEGGSVDEEYVEDAEEEDDSESDDDVQPKGGKRRRKEGVTDGEEEEEEDDEDEDEEDDGELYCYCQQPWGGRFMIGCDVCGGWFHGDCVGITEDGADALDVFVCEPCKREKLVDCDDEEVLGMKLNKDPKPPVKRPTSSSSKESRRRAEAKPAPAAKGRAAGKKTASPEKKDVSPEEKLHQDNKVRDIVRKAFVRALGAGDASSSSSSMEELAVEVESALYEHFGGKVDKEYKAKFRSLSFNLSDTKNLELRNDVLSGAITVGRLITMSAEELASSSLKELRKQRAELLEKQVIKSVIGGTGQGGEETGLVWKKTHKGEELVKLEDDTFDDHEEVAEQANAGWVDTREANEQREIDGDKAKAETSGRAAVGGDNTGISKRSGGTGVGDVDLDGKVGDDGGADADLPDFDSFEAFKAKRASVEDSREGGPSDAGGKEPLASSSARPPASKAKRASETGAKAKAASPSPVKFDMHLRKIAGVTETDAWVGVLKFTDPTTQDEESERHASVRIAVSAMCSAVKGEEGAAGASISAWQLPLPASLQVVGRLSTSKVVQFVKQVVSSSRSRAVCIASIRDAEPDNVGGKVEEGRMAVAPVSELAEGVVKSKKAAVLLRTDALEAYMVPADAFSADDGSPDAVVRVLLIYRIDGLRKQRMAPSITILNGNTDNIQRDLASPEAPLVSPVETSLTHGLHDAPRKQAKKESLASHRETAPAVPANAGAAATTAPVPQLHSLHQLQSYLKGAAKAGGSMQSTPDASEGAGGGANTIAPSGGQEQGRSAVQRPPFGPALGGIPMQVPPQQQRYHSQFPQQYNQQYLVQQQQQQQQHLNPIYAQQHGGGTQNYPNGVYQGAISGHQHMFNQQREFNNQAGQYYQHNEQHEPTMQNPLLYQNMQHPLVSRQQQQYNVQGYGQASRQQSPGRPRHRGGRGRRQWD